MRFNPTTIILLFLLAAATTAAERTRIASDGQFEQSEDLGEWRRKQRFDSNKDGSINLSVHHANDLNERSAPVQVTIVKNAGHNWRAVGSAIAHRVNDIVFNTVSYLVQPLANAPKAQASQSRLPAFSWNRLPRYIHVRKTDEFTPEEIRYLASHPLITFEKTTGREAYDWTGTGTLKAAEAVKQLNPDAKVLFYRNVLVHYDGYSFDERLKAISDPFLVDKTGNDKVIRRRVRAYDLSNEQVRQWWVNSMVSVCNRDSIDGLFLDGNVKVLSTFLNRDLPDGKPAQVIEGFNKMMRDTRKALRDDKLMIANILRARFADGGLEFIENFDGSYLEGFEHEVSGVSKADYIAKGIETVQKAARSGKMIALTLNVAGSSMGDGVDELGRDLEELAGIRQSRVDYCIALFLVMAERHSYLNIHDGYDVNSNDKGKCASKLWLQTLPEFERPLGRPLGPATKAGYRYSREFEHASVRLDIESNRGSVSWK